MAPEIFVKVMLSGELCHCRVQEPVPAVVVLPKVAVAPEQIVVAPVAVTPGSATTVTATEDDVAASQLKPVQVLVAR